MVDPVSIIASVVASVIASLAVVEYRFQREDIRESSQEIENWYSDAAELGRDVQTTWQTKFQRPNRDDGPIEYDEVQREMNLYSNQLSNHASQAASLDVSEDVVSALEETAQACRGVYEIHTHSHSQPEFEDQGEVLMEAAGELEELALSEL
jgi:hypothetical protein